MPAGVIPRVVAVGTTFTLEEFRGLGPFRIESKLIYDNYVIDANEAGCTGIGIGSENVEYPVRTSGGGIFCVKILSDWIALGNNTDPKRAPIVNITVMTQEQIMQQEWTDIQNQRRMLNTKINILKKKRQETTDNKEAMSLVGKQRDCERELEKLPPTPQDHMEKKLERKGMNRVLPKLKF